MVFGAAAFWLPDAIWHIVRGSNFSGRDAFALTALMPLVLLAAFVLIKRLYVGGLGEHAGLPMMLGVWMLGGLFIGFGGLLSGSYAGRADGLQSALYVALIGFVPPLPSRKRNVSLMLGLPFPSLCFEEVLMSKLRLSSLCGSIVVDYASVRLSFLWEKTANRRD
jgi:hypothetical protein